MLHEDIIALNEKLVRAIPLTEEEREEAYFEKQKVKYFKEKHKEYWHKYKNYESE